MAKHEQYYQRIVRLRENLGWSQTELARQSGVKQASLSRIERGVLKGTSTARTFRRLAEALNVSIQYLKYGTLDEEQYTQNLSMSRHEKMETVICRPGHVKFVCIDEIRNDTTDIKRIIKLTSRDIKIMTDSLDNYNINDLIAVQLTDNVEVDSMHKELGSKFNLCVDDVLLFATTKEPKHNSLVLATNDNKKEIRLFIGDKDNAVLKPLNPQYPITDANNCKIEGVLVSKFHNYE